MSRKSLCPTWLYRWPKDRPHCDHSALPRKVALVTEGGYTCGENTTWQQQGADHTGAVNVYTCSSKLSQAAIRIHLPSGGQRTVSRYIYACKGKPSHLAPCLPVAGRAWSTGPGRTCDWERCGKGGRGRACSACCEDFGTASHEQEGITSSAINYCHETNTADSGGTCSNHVCSLNVLLMCYGPVQHAPQG